MQAARPGRRKTDPKLPRELCVAASHERCGFLMSNLNETNLFLTLSERLHDSVDAITRHPEDDVDPPFRQDVNENICCSLRHSPGSSHIIVLTLGPRCVERHTATCLMAPSFVQGGTVASGFEDGRAYPVIER